MYTDEFPNMLKDFAPARSVPVMKKDGIVVCDTLAIAETLAETFPDKPFWPKAPAARAFARSIVAEMHAGFGALRGACPMNLEYQWDGFKPDADVLADCQRMEYLWQSARTQFGEGGKWLFGEYSIADVFFAPAATRFVTYNLPRSEAAQVYIDSHLNDKTFRRWRAMGRAQNYRQPNYDMQLPTKPWPGPKPLDAAPVPSGPSENATCPYSGDPVTDFLAIKDRTFGFCNPFCRDKTLADPEAWDDFMAVYQK